MIVPGTTPPIQPPATAQTLSPERNRHEPSYSAVPVRAAGLQEIPAGRWIMSGTISSGRKAGPEVTRRRGGRRWLITAVVVVVVAAAVIVAAAEGVFKGSGSRGPGAAATAYRTSTTTVKRETLTSQ